MLSCLSWNPELRRDGEKALGGFFAGSFMFLALPNWISQAVMLSPHLMKFGWLSCAASSVLTERKGHTTEENKAVLEIQ